MRLCSSCTVLMSVRSWIMVMFYVVQLGNQSLSLLTVCRMRRCALVLEHCKPILVEAGELLVELRRQQLCLHYICKLRSNSCNPPSNSVFRTSFQRLFEARPNTVPTLGIRLNQTIVESEINVNNIAVNSTHYIPPWVLKPL